jgi:hypothetical protein
MLVLADAMERDPSRANTWNCFLGIDEIARRTDLAARTVRKAVAEMRKSPMPLVQIDTPKPGQRLTTRGRRHPSNRYTINTHIRLPAAYAAKRDSSTVERGARQAGRTGTQKKRTLNDKFDSLADLLVKRGDGCWTTELAHIGGARVGFRRGAAGADS